MRAVEALMRLPVLQRSALAGAVCGGVLGGVAGLVLGLLAYPPTAWFAVFELGIPAAMAGGILGLISGSVVLAVRRLLSLFCTSQLAIIEGAAIARTGDYSRFS
jgi:riboflavin transporter FmnP